MSWSEAAAWRPDGGGVRVHVPARVPCLQWAPQDGSHPSGRRGRSRWQKQAARRAGAEQPAAPAVRNVLENHLPGGALMISSPVFRCWALFFAFFFFSPAQQQLKSDF